MKVILAVCNTNKYFGLPKYFYLLAKYLTRRGVDVSLIIDSINGISKVREIYDGKVINLDCETHSAVTTARYCLKLRDYLLEQSFDVLHTGHINPYFYLMSKHRPVVFQPFGNELFTLAGRGLNMAYCKAAQPVLRYCGHNADALLAEGSFQWGEMVKIYDNESRMKILPVGIETNVPRKTHFNEAIYNILAVNSLLPYEGMDRLIDAFKVVCAKFPATLTIVGTGPLEAELKKQAVGYPVVFLKNLPEHELQALYANSSLFVSTSDETDTQMGILEAEAAGLPIVSTGQHWLISGNGVVSDDIAGAILRVHGSNQRILSDCSRKMAERYSFEKIAEQAIAIYQGL